MRASIAAILLAIMFVDAAFGFHTVTQMKSKYKRRQELMAKQNNQGLPEQFLVQKLDHFSQDSRTWKQRYYVDTSVWNGQGPIFFQIGGETALEGTAVQAVQMTNYGRTYGALLVTLEHRFYGKSQPLNDLSTASLSYLTSQQALADAANFIQYIQKQYKASNSQVITFGCSYPGNLAAWFRLKYPNITAGSVASSAPVQATADFFQYMEVVDRSLTTFTGPKCHQLIQQATNQIENMLQTSSGKKKVEKMFNVCAPLNGTKDIAVFMQGLMANWMRTVQFNDEFQNPVNINYLCNIMTSADSALSGYIQVNNLFLQGQPCMNCNYEQQIVGLNTSSIDDNYYGGRQWLYQTCNEFGYFQTTDSPNQPFGNLVPLSYYTGICRDVFGIVFNPNNIDATNAYYGGQKISANAASNILFVNGEIDPYHPLGITWDISPTLLHILIADTSHCANAFPDDPNDPADLRAARQLTSKIIGTWLN